MPETASTTRLTSAGCWPAACLLAWILGDKINDEASIARRQGSAFAGVAMCVVAVVALVVATPVPTIHHRQIFRFQAEFNRLLPELQADEKKFQADLKSVREANMTAEQFNEAIGKTHLPAWKKIQVALAPFTILDNDTAGANMRDVTQQSEI